MRHREQFQGEYSLFPLEEEGWKMPLTYKVIKDVNNGRRRPESPCYIVKAVASPIPSQLTIGGPGYTGNIYVPLPAYVAHIEGLAANDLGRTRAVLERKVQSVRKDLKQQFSTLNFMSELREVGSLFKRADQTWRHWSEVRGIDYQFGVAPMIADLRNALKHYNSVANRINDLTKRYRNVPIDTGGRYYGSRVGPLSFALGNEHFQDDFWVVKGRVRGEISVAFPWLAQVNPELFFVLDQLAINPSFGNFWEAVPFSWLLDWFLPIGEFLETLPDVMSPECHFSGTFSFKTTGHSIETTLSSGPAWSFYDGQPAGQHMCRIYLREAHNFPLAGRVKWDFMGGINSLAKMSIIRDILYPAKDFRPPRKSKKPRLKKPKKD